MKRKICFITGTRAEYGLMRQLILNTSKEQAIITQLIVTGSHLSRNHGLTYKEIESDGIEISKKIDLKIQGDSAEEIANYMSLALKGFAKVFSFLKPDLVVVLGDRYEIFSATTAAMISNIPIAHIHGGETTEGAFDEAMRHSITKMSHLHFVAASEYKKRVHQLGENLSNIFLVGGLGVDAIHSLTLLNKQELEKSMDFSFGKKNLLITIHPETLEKNKTTKNQVSELLEALDEINDTKFIFTLPNADTDNLQITNLIKQFHKRHMGSSVIFSSLGQLRYLSALKFVDGIIGNSSSGLTEAPSFQIGTINLGDRQSGRLKAESVLDCDFEKKKIIFSIKKMYSKSFQNKLSIVSNPYGKAGASKKILRTMKKFPLKGILKKKFYDL